MQWWIDTAGKLGPAIIAALVLLTTRSQNRALNAVTARAASVEDQKFKLALLDRRIEAIDAIRDAVGQYSMTGIPTGETQGRLIDALRVAQLVFREDDERAIAACIKTGSRWRTVNYRSARANDDASQRELVEELVQLDAQFERQSNELLIQLIASTRVSDLSPLEWPNGFWQSMASRVIRRRPMR